MKKEFKNFRSTLTEAEYAEVITGNPSRSAYSDEGLHTLTPKALAGINAVLAAISRSTYLDCAEALMAIKVRLNVLMLDFPNSWLKSVGDSGVGSFDIPVTRFGRVDGYDALTGDIRMDGKANSPGGFKQLNLHVDVALNSDSLYVVSANITNKEESPVAESRAYGLRKAAKREAAEERAKWGPNWGKKTAKKPMKPADKTS